jgi:tRNA pseudouridine synthase 10
MDILRSALQMLREHPVCDHCLGRQFALLGYGMQNEERGRAIKTLLTLRGHQMALSKDRAGNRLMESLALNGSFEIAREVLRRLGEKTGAGRKCYLCNGLFTKTDSLAMKAVEKLDGYEYETLLIGVRLPHEITEREDEFKARYNVTHGESIRSHLSHEIGKQTCNILKKKASYREPDIVIIVDPTTDTFRLQVTPLHIAGRYRKLVRNIPQSQWQCKECSGRGCLTCNWTGKKYQESVEEIIGAPLIKMTKGKESVLHGAGREDIDVRMLGSGRPFVIEIKEPKKRRVDLKKLERKINKHAKGKVEVHKLRVANKKTVRQYKKSQNAEKTYTATIEFERDVSDQELEKVERSLSGTVIQQQTPKRVLHRRADLQREKYIYTTKLKRKSQNRVEIHIHCQGGLYIKELITGDGGRTKPSVTSITGAQAKNLSLDVLQVFTGEEDEEIERLQA